MDNTPNDIEDIIPIACTMIVNSEQKIEELQDEIEDLRIKLKKARKAKKRWKRIALEMSKGENMDKPIVGDILYTKDGIKCIVTEVGCESFFVKPLKPYGGIEDNLYIFSDIGKTLFKNKNGFDEGKL